MYVLTSFRIMILLLVAVSIGWIPLIQQMQGGQMYVYIQSIAAYISPPIAMTFCMAMTWARMNEAVRTSHILLLMKLRIRKTT